MAKVGKLIRIKSMLKKMQPFKLGPTNYSSIIVGNFFNECSSKDLHGIYIGKSQRHYLVTSEVMENPLFLELSEHGGDKSLITIGCEVVLFDHLWWMLDNSDPHPKLLDELVEFYLC
ncbi:auxin-responsive protein SAUR76-like [Andrographis paniculata]|uniref:auxin-responsive protein SAUR76-like n=1 Tax=Andrographis paniculata TaxID=175694 RepID=UPI0021E7A05E|nr:auxin-responsive protein SAUR76-like [Andrographis paniculata]